MSNMVNKQYLIDTLTKNGYNPENYPTGIKVHMNSDMYIDISRQPNNILMLDVCNKEGECPNSLELLDDYGRIRSESLISVLDKIKHKF